MFAYIIIYRDVIGHIFAKSIAKCLSLVELCGALLGEL